MGRRIRAVLIVLIGIGLGSLHDLLFINLNYQIDHVRRATPVSFAHSRFQSWVDGWGTPGLSRLKWMLGCFFILSMWGLCLLLLRNAHALERLARPVTGVFAGIAFLALLLHGLSRWIPVEEASVNLLHAIQYPVLLVVLQLALMLFPGIRSGPR